MISILPAVRRFARRAIRRSEPIRFGALAWLAAPAVEVALATIGLERTLRVVEGLPRGHAGLSQATRVGEGEGLVAIAFRLHVALRGHCLPRALVQYALHRLDGTPARFVVGVRRGQDAPIDAHAWVEAPDQPPPSGFQPLLVADSRP